MKPPTKQEMFNRMVRGLASQGWVLSSNGAGLCRYRGEAGRKCAVGWLIPDDEYQPSMDSSVWAAEDVLENLYDGLTPSLFRFASDAQGCHDLAHSAEQMSLNFERLAEKHGLDWPEDVK